MRILLFERQRENVSLLTLSLSDIKECELEVCADPDVLLERLQRSQTGMVLLDAGSDPHHAIALLQKIHEMDQSVYVIVSVPDEFQDATDSFMKVGAHDFVFKDRNYVPHIVSAVKKGLIRIAEREAFEVPVLARAQQLALDENLPDIILSLDLDGGILYANHAIFTLLGYHQKEVVGVGFETLLHDPAGQNKFKTYLEAVDQQISFREVVLLKHQKGESICFDVNFTLMEGEIIYGVARKQIEADSGFAEISNDNIEELQVEDRAPDPAEGLPARIGAYRIVTLLGAGAMGRVYKGFDEQLERFVAIKVVSKSLAENQTYIERFKREAKILASISHPNIALVYYFGSLEGLPYFCMEYLASGSIESLLQLRTVIDPDNAVSYVIQAAAGLREALSKGVLHMDVKPSNLMLADEGRLKIVDFGLAQTKRHRDDLDRNIIGTPLYIAPEQIIGGVSDARMDIYSLGITFFEMLYGFTPFTGESVPDIFQAKLKGSIPLRSELNPAVPGPFYQLVTRMIARDPEERISSYSELIEELEGVWRTSVGMEESREMTQPEASVVVTMRGLLFDQPFAELLGKIVTHQPTGKLTVTWGQLAKQLHFRQGRLIALLSNQEGEDFIELVISRLPDEAKRMRKLQSHQSLDLFEDYSTVIQKISVDARTRLSQDLRTQAQKILQNLFSWMTGEYIFEQGEFPRQLDLDVDTFEFLDQGVRKFVQYDLIRRRLFEGRCTLRHDPDFIRFLRNLNLPPSDRFLLFRFETEILYGQLYELSNMSEEEFGRLVYLFSCLGLIHIVKEEKVESRPEPGMVSAQAGDVLPEQTPKNERTQPDPATYYTHWAAKSFGEKNYWACVEYCKKALEHRQDPNVYRLMGRALATHPRFRTDALDAYKKALELLPGDAGIERDIADLYFQSGSMGLAKTKYESLLKNDPSDQHAAKRLQEIHRRAR